jgi:WD40 repeat protein
VGATLLLLQVGHTTATPQALQLTDDGTFAFSASGARKLIRWDMATGTPSLCLQQKQGSRMKCMYLSADGNTAVVLLFDSTMAVFDTRLGQMVCEFMKKGERDAMRVHSGGVNGVLLTEDGSRAVSWSKDATARVWDTSTGACMLVLQVGAVHLLYSLLVPVYRLLSFVCIFGTVLYLWYFGILALLCLYLW